jgi:hypothetical protein
MSAAAVLPFFMTANVWPLSPPKAGEPLRDVNGVLITVGATVKLVGVVTAVSSTDPHFSGIQVAPSHPNGPGGSNPILGITDSQNPQLGQSVNPQQPVNYYFDPLQIIVGS